jgi:hypothetical protein
MKIADLKMKHKNKWILVKVIKEAKNHSILDVMPLKISDEREEVYAHLQKLKKGAHVATLFTGKIPPKGMTFTFYASI